MTTVEFYAPIRVEPEEFVDLIHEVIAHEEVAEFVKTLDLRYQDFEVTEGIITELLKSLTKEYEVTGGQQLNEWNTAVTTITNLMEEFN